MSGSIEFWFDLSSPYAYFASLDIEAVAERHGRSVLWKPFLLGVMFKVTGNAPLVDQPLKGDYSKRDWERLARMEGLVFALRSDFPLATQAPARMILAVEAEAGSAAAGGLAKRLLGAHFVEGLNIGDAATAASVAVSLGFDRDRLEQAASDPAWKAELRARCDEAVRRGIFGSPWIVVDGEPFWGGDRLPMVDRWLSTGGW